MQYAKFCPKCGSQNTMIFSDMLGKPFTLDNKPSLPRGDSLHAGVKFDETSPLFSPGICEDCGTWFGIFGTIYGIKKKQELAKYIIKSERAKTSAYRAKKKAEDAKRDKHNVETLKVIWDAITGHKKDNPTDGYA